MIKDWQTLSSKLFCFCIFAFFGYLFFEHLFLPIFPFLLAAVLSWIMYKIALKISRLTGVPYKACAFFLVMLCFCLFGCALFFICRHLVSEISGIMSIISDGNIFSLIPASAQNIPVLEEAFNFFENALEDNAKSFISEILSRAYSLAGAVVGRVIKGSPTFLLSAFVFIISVCYMSMDMPKILELISNLFSKNKCKSVDKIKQSTFSVTAGYLKANVYLFLITFCETLIGLLILHPRYAVLGAVCTACIDILPVLGAGFVLIPWGILSLLSGNIFRGVGMLILYIIITVVRQISEPKIIGKKMGIHPLLAIMSMFLGARLFGIGGMLLLPVLISIVVNVLKEK